MTLGVYGLQIIFSELKSEIMQFWYHIPSGMEHYPPAGSSWRFNKDKIEELISDNRIWFGEDGNNKPRLKDFAQR